MFGYFVYQYDSRVIRYAESLTARGDSVEVVCIGIDHDSPRESIRGVPVIRILRRRLDERTRASYARPLVGFLLKGACIMTLRHLRHPFDLVHVHVPPDFHAMAVLLLRLMGARIILDIHDLTPELYANKYNNGQPSVVVRMLTLIEKLSCRMANHVIAANDLWRTTLVSRSVPDKRCTTLINYPGPLFMREQKKLLPQPGVPLVLYPGSIGPHQGLSVALNAVRHLLDRNIPVHLAIYSCGPEEQSLRKLVEELELKNAVTLHRPVPLDQISSVMASAAVGIVPKLAEGFGGRAFSTKILEFMAVGVPVLVSATPIDTFYFNDSLVEFFKSGDAKDCALHLERLLRDKELRSSRIKAGRSFVELNNWESKKSIYFDIVNSVTSSAIHGENCSLFQNPFFDNESRH